MAYEGITCLGSHDYETPAEIIFKEALCVCVCVCVYIYIYMYIVC